MPSGGSGPVARSEDRRRLIEDLLRCIAFKMRRFGMRRCDWLVEKFLKR